MNFAKQLRDLAEEALAFIHEKAKGGIVFYEPDYDDDGYMEKLYECPRATSVTKHGFYLEYAVTSLHIDETGEVVAKGVEITEGDGELDEYISTLPDSEIIYIAHALEFPAEI